MARLLKAFIFAGFVLLFFAAVSFGFLFILSGGDPVGYIRTTYVRIIIASQQEELDTPAGVVDTEQIFKVTIGDTPTAIANNLFNAGLITDTELFLNYLIAEEIDRQLEAGTYFLKQTQTIPEIAYTLTDSRNASISFRVIEGSRMEEIAATLDANPRFQFSGDDFLAVVGVGAEISSDLAEQYGIPVGASLEGFLYPDSYILPPDVTPERLRDILLVRFSDFMNDQLIIDAAAQGLSIYEAVTLGSIIEREAVHPDEFAMIASVYRNRLDINMTLDADPTVQYALNDTRGTWWAQITLADYRGVISPYNTYLNFGLPPSPIANPTIGAIRAAIYPENTEFLFFRVRCDGSFYHQFAKTYEEHLNNGC